MLSFADLYKFVIHNEEKLTKKLEETNIQNIENTTPMAGKALLTYHSIKAHKTVPILQHFQEKFDKNADLSVVPFCKQLSINSKVREFASKINITFIIQEQQQDPIAKNILDNLDKHKDFRLQHGVLFFKNKIFSTKKISTQIILSLHLSTHLTHRIIYKILQQYLHCKYLKKLTRLVVKSCGLCEIHNPMDYLDDNTTSHLFRPSASLETVYIDHVLFTNAVRANNKRYIGILSIQCGYSAYLLSQLVTSLSLSATIEAIRKVNALVNFRGTHFKADNFSTFVSKDFHNYIESIGCSISHTLPYSSRSNALVESAHNPLRTLLRIFHDSGLTNIVEAFEAAVISYNLGMAYAETLIW